MRFPPAKYLSRFPIFIATAFLVLAWNAIFSQEVSKNQNASDDSEGSVYTLQVYEDLVLVDVTVTDKKGNAVRDLRKEDFRLTEDGVAQAISTFDFEDLSRLETPDATVQPLTLPPLVSGKMQPGPPLNQFQNHRLLILFMDQSSMPVEDSVQAQKAMADFIKHQLTPADLVAVVVNSSVLKVVQNFTNDISLLQKAVQKLSLGDSADLAAMGSTPDDSTTDSSDTGNYSQDDTQFNIFNTDRKLMAIESTGKFFRNLPGKKFLVHFSSGITTTGTENQAQLRSTVDTLNQSTVSLYAVDVRGLTALPPGGDATQASQAGTASFSGKAMRDQTSSLASSQETLSTLSEDTGGKALLDNNNLGKVFENVRNDSSSYYLLGYYSSNTRRDGRFRKITVQLNHPDLRLKFREGYFAPKSFQQYTRSDREKQLQEAASTDRPFSEIPFLLGTQFLRAAGGHTFVSISLQFPASAVPFVEKGKARRAGFDFIGQVWTARGKPENVMRDTLEVNLDPETAKKALAGEIQYNSAFFLKPGSYKLKFLVRENQTGKLGTFQQDLLIPDFEKPPFSVSSLVVGNQLKPAMNRDHSVKRSIDYLNLRPGDWEKVNPLIVGDQVLIPSVTHFFSRKDNLYIFFQSYLNQTRGTQPDLRGSLRFYRDDKLFRDSGNLGFDAWDEDAPGTVTGSMQIALNDFLPGEYQIELNLKDEKSGTTQQQKTRMVIR